MKSFFAALAATAVSATVTEKFSEYATKQVSNGFTDLQIEVDGVAKTYYVAADWQSGGGSNYRVPSNGRGYITETPTLDQANPKYFLPNLLGGAVEYDTDLSSHECGCIAAFYLVSMPGKDSNGNLWMGTDGYGYCDANQVAGNWCPEFDIMEANKWAWGTTPHSCDSPSDKGFYSNCDRGGACYQRTKDDYQLSSYGPGDQYQINTNKSFHTKITFDADSNGQFTSYTTTLTQEGRTQQMTSSCSSLNQMSWDISNGMGFAISNWGGDATWLWGDKCYGSCNWPELNFDNIKVTTGSVTPGPGPTPGPYNPSDYDFGDNCSGVDDDCGSQGCGQDHCKWAWRKDDPQQWSSPDAHCRCDVI